MRRVVNHVGPTVLARLLKHQPCTPVVTHRDGLQGPLALLPEYVTGGVALAALLDLWRLLEGEVAQVVFSQVTVMPHPVLEGYRDALRRPHPHLGCPGDAPAHRRAVRVEVGAHVDDLAMAQLLGLIERDGSTTGPGGIDPLVAAVQLQVFFLGVFAGGLGQLTLRTLTSEVGLLTGHPARRRLEQHGFTVVVDDVQLLGVVGRRVGLGEHVGGVADDSLRCHGRVQKLDSHFVLLSRKSKLRFQLRVTAQVMPPAASAAGAPHTTPAGMAA